MADHINLLSSLKFSPVFGCCFFSVTVKRTEYVRALTEPRVTKKYDLIMSYSVSVTHAQNPFHMLHYCCVLIVYSNSWNKYRY